LERAGERVSETAAKKFVWNPKERLPGSNIILAEMLTAITN
jgi:hypothetical protein